jgi:hypothetical protein
MSNKIAVIGRDSFARHDIIRQKVETQKNCSWCGNRSAKDNVYQYGINEDQNNRNQFSDKVFCCVGCYRSLYV